MELYHFSDYGGSTRTYGGLALLKFADPNTPATSVDK